MNYQDRSKTLTVEQLRQRYNLDGLSGDRKAIQNNRNGLTRIEAETESILKSIIINLGDTLESQSEISLWFFDGIPTLSNRPYTDWQNPNNHVGDIYYDRSTGYVYIFQLDEGVYSWVRNEDASLIQAMALTNAAIDTEDNIRNVFFSTPSPPYDNGDWYVDDNGDLYICQISKPSGEEYSENDFIIASKYTDDTKANQVAGKLTIVAGQVTTIIQSLEIISQTIEDNRYYVDEQGNRHLISESVSSLVQTVDSITTTVSEQSTVLGNHTQRISTVEQTVDGISSTVSEQSEELGEHTQRISTVEQTVDGITSTVSNQGGRISQIEQEIDNIDLRIEEIVETVDKASGTGILQFNSSINNPGYELKIRNACQLFPRTDLYPSTTLYPLGRWLRITYSDNTYTRYQLPVLALRNLNGVYDELWIKSGKVSIVKKIGMDANKELYLLQAPVITTYDDIELDIREGTNQIILESFPNALFDIEYMIESIFTDTFSTHAQTRAEIKIAKDGILEEVSQKADTSYVEALIELTTGQITESVSRSEEIIWDDVNQKAYTTDVETSLENVTNNLTSEIGRSNTQINNNYQEIMSKFDGYTPTNRTVELETSVNRIQTNTYTKEEITTKLTDGSVTKVHTISGTFDENGMTYEKTNANTKTTINEIGINVKDRTNNSILFAGYVDENNTQYSDYEGQTLVATENMIVTNYFVTPGKSRFQEYDDGTGIFY